MAKGNSDQDENRKEQEEKGNDRSHFFFYLIILAIIVLIFILLFRTCDNGDYEPVKAPPAEVSFPVSEPDSPQPSALDSTVAFPDYERSVTGDVSFPLPERELDATVDMGKPAERSLDVDVDMGKEPERELETTVDMGKAPERTLDADVDMGKPAERELDVNVDMGEPAERSLDVDVDMGKEPERELETTVDMGKAPERTLDADVDMGKPAERELDVNVDMGEPAERSLDVDVDMGKEPERELETTVDMGKAPERTLDADVDMGKPAERELDVNVDMGEPAERSLDVDVDMGKEPERELETTVDMGKAPERTLDADVDMGKPAERTLDADVDMGKPAERSLDVDVDMGKAPERELNVDVDMGELAERTLYVSVDMGQLPERELGVVVDMGKPVERSLDVDVDMGEMPQRELGVDVDMGKEPERELDVEVDMGEEPERELDVEVDMGKEPERELDVEVDMGKEPERELDVEVDMGEPEEEPERELDATVDMGDPAIGTVEKSELTVRIKEPLYLPVSGDNSNLQLVLGIEVDGREVPEIPTDTDEPWCVREFIFYGSEILRYGELQDLAEKCLDTRNDEDVILEVAIRVTGLYRDKDLPDAMVAIPVQDITEGVVIIALDDGPDTEPQQQEKQPEEDEDTFHVIQIVFSESQIYKEKELDEIVEESREDHDGMDLLFDVIDRVNEGYEDRGYPNAYAYLPEQEVDDGVFFVQLVEGRLGSFIVVDNIYTDDTYFLSRFRIDREKPLNLSDFEHQLMKFNLWSSGYAATATITPGETAGTSDIVLHAVEAYPATLTLQFDNFGSEATGKFRFGVHFAYDSVYKHRDILMVGITGNGNSYSPYLDYSLLTPRINMRYGVRGSFGRSNIINGAGSGYDIKESNENVVVYSSVPLQQSLLSQLVLSGNIGYSHAKSEAMGVELSNIKLGSAQLGVNFTFAPASWLFLYTYHNINLGTEFDDNPYIWVDGGLNMSLNVYDGLILKVTSKYQVEVNGTPLPGSLLFQTGGATSVRGYAEGCGFGESGAFASGEAHIPVELLDIYGFVDFAYFKPVPDTGENLIWSWGVGAEGKLGGFVTGVFFGLPQIDITQDPAATQGRIYFYVKLSPTLSIFS